MHIPSFEGEVTKIQFYAFGTEYNDNNNEIDLFRHHNGNNTNIKVIFKQVTMGGINAIVYDAKGIILQQ